MTPQELKNSVLQRAFQGKLVEQRPEEGTGEELYRQIQAEKQRLIKEGKIKKDKNESVIFRRDNSHYEKILATGEVKCIDDEIPFVEDIPDNSTDETFLMEDIQKILEKMSPLDRFLLQRILIDGTKPRDVLDGAREYVLHEPSLKTAAKDKEAFAGYIYTRYNRARKSLQHQLTSLGYGR